MAGAFGNKVVVVELGRVSVDSGHLLITDPCYVLPSDKDTGKEWDQFLVNATKNDEWNKSLDQPKNPGIPTLDGLGLIIPSGMGDGQYIVTAEVEHLGSWGWRTRTITIHVLDDPDGLDDEADLEDED
jgi:hypothetical protein